MDQSGDVVNSATGNTVMAHKHVSICVLEGPSHIFTLINENHLPPLFEQKRNLLGKAIAEVLPELKSQEFVKRLDEVYVTCKPYVESEMPLDIAQPDNSVKKMYIEFICYPARGMDNKLKKLLLVVVDITEKVNDRIRDEQNEVRYHALTDSISQLMWTASPDGHINYANKPYQEYIGLETFEKFNQYQNKILHNDDVNEVVQTWTECIKTGKPFIKEYRLKRADGQYRWFLDRTLPVKNKKNEILYWIGTATDIDDQKKITSELALAKESAELANSTKSAFLANMSHEIRTPLGAILGFSGLLKDAHLSEAVREQYINTINRNGLALTHIIDDILDLAKVEAGKINIEAIDFSLVDLVQEVVGLFNEKVKEKGLTMSLNVDENVPHMIASDPTRLRQILINIIGNAVKFTDSGSITIQVKLQQEIESSLQLAVSVKDTGPGLTEEQKNRLFKPFSQGDNTMTRQYGGTGLGLVLSQRLAEALGGQVTIENCSPGKGCTFVISFIATKSQKIHMSNLKTEEPIAFQASSLPLKDIRVLLVDDSADNLFLVKRILTKFGAEVDLATDGAEAIDKAISNTHDIVLMDIQMPKMDGYRAIEILNKKNYCKPIVALTAHAMVEEKNRTKDAGFAAHLTKPVNVNELIQSIRTLTHH